MKTIVAIMAAIMTLGANYAVAQTTTSPQNLELLARYLQDRNVDMESLVVICKDDPSVSSDFQTLAGLIQAGVELGDAQKFITSLNAARNQAIPSASTTGTNSSPSAEGTDAVRARQVDLQAPGQSLPAMWLGAYSEPQQPQGRTVLERVNAEITARLEGPAGQTYDWDLSEYSTQDLYRARYNLETELSKATGNMQGPNAFSPTSSTVYQARPANVPAQYQPTGSNMPATPTQGFSMKEFGKDNAGLLLGLGGAFLTKATGNSNAGWEEQVRRGLIFGPTIQRGMEGAKDPSDQSAEAWIGRGVGALGSGLGGILGLGR